MDRMNEAVTLRFTGSDRTVTGRVLGITPAGALRLETSDGETVVHAGEVTTAPASTPS
jgi:BirA family biotin operon repressor/biotin-[acetyl-CoA-carboxylase] ligase